MLTKQSDNIKRLAIFLGKLQFLKRMLKPLYQTYQNWLERRRKALFQKYGLEVLKCFDECLTTNGYIYTLAFGTMLGAVREHGFISHDQDIDVAMWIEDYSPDINICLQERGFKLIHALTIDSGRLGREETFEYKGVFIDVFYIYPAIDTYPYYCDFIEHEGSVSFEDSMKKYGYIIPRRIQMPWKKELQRINFAGLNLPICTNAKELLKFRYGDDYMTPKSNWSYKEMNKYTTIWTEKQAVVAH